MSPFRAEIACHCHCYVATPCLLLQQLVLARRFPDTPHHRRCRTTLWPRSGSSRTSDGTYDLEVDIERRARSMICRYIPVSDLSATCVVATPLGWRGWAWFHLLEVFHGFALYAPQTHCYPFCPFVLLYFGPSLIFCGDEVLTECVCEGNRFGCTWHGPDISCSPLTIPSPVSARDAGICGRYTCFVRPHVGHSGADGRDHWATRTPLLLLLLPMSTMSTLGFAVVNVGGSKCRGGLNTGVRTDGSCAPAKQNEPAESRKYL